MSVSTGYPSGNLQRFNRANPCPICGGFAQMKRGQGNRCHGFLSSGGGYAHCARGEHAGGLALHKSGDTYAHKLTGSCLCGATHGVAREAPRRKAKRAASEKPTPWTHTDADAEMVHSYEGDNGELLFEVIRFTGEARKCGLPTCKPRHRIGGGWFVGQGPTRGSDVPLYRQAEAVAELEQGGTVYICEGERDCDAVADAGGVACCNVYGAMKFREARAQALAAALKAGEPSARLVVVADADAEGERHAADVMSKLIESGAPANNVSTAHPTAGKDAADHLAAGFGLADFRDALDGLVVRFDTVQPQRWEWFMQDRIPFGAVTLIHGLAGLGKSAAVHDLIARASSGKELPDGSKLPPMNVLIATREDDLGKTLVPRMQLAGADLKRIQWWNKAPCADSKQRPPNVMEHLGTLRDLVRKFRIRLVVIDPWTTFIGVGPDSNKAQDMADACSRFQELIGELDVACIAIEHPAKGKGRAAIERVIGSTKIMGTFRAALEVVEDRDDSAARLMAQSKANNSAPAGAFRFRVFGGMTPEGIGTAAVEWCGVLEGVTAQELDRQAERGPSPSCAKAMAFLEANLANATTFETGVPSQELRGRAVCVGISKNAIYDAKQELGVQSDKGFGSEAVWWLPESEE